MARFTALDPDDITAIAAAAELGPVTAVTPIAAGTINSNFAFTTATGRYFVRVNEGKSAADVAWEAALVIALAGAGLPTPAPRTIGGRPWLEHRGLLVSVFPWIAGTSRSPDAVSVADAAVLGDHLGWLHAAARPRWPAEGRDGIYQWPAIVARLDDIAARGDPHLAEAVELLTATRSALATAADLRAAATRGIVHGDLFRDNVLWTGDVITALLDFEQAATGSLVYDVAVAVNDWCWTDTLAVDRAAALVAAHRRRWRWTTADAAAFPHELVAAAARFTITRITDVYLRQVDNPDKDYRAFLARLALWRSPVGAQISTTLAAL